MENGTIDEGMVNCFIDLTAQIKINANIAWKKYMVFRNSCIAAYIVMALTVFGIAAQFI